MNIATRSPRPARALVRRASLVLATTAAVLAGGASAARANPTASFTATPSGLAVSFNANASSDVAAGALSFAWDFGDGANGTGSTPSHTYATAGTRTVTLTVTNSVTLLSGTATKSVTPNRPPTASFTFSPTLPNPGQGVQFDSSASSDPDGPITRAWDFGDGAKSTASVVTHAYKAGGTFTVRLTVTDNLGATAFATQTVIVNHAPVISSITASPAIPAIGVPTTFTAVASDVELGALLFSWSIDGAPSPSVLPQVVTTFPTGGPHTATLTVTDVNGATATKSQTVKVDVPPNASFTVSPAAPLIGQTVTFTSTSSDPDGTIASTVWDLNGRGTFTDASGPTASRSFAVGGNYVVRMRVTDNNGAVSEAAVTVPVGQPPTAHFAFTPAAPLVGDTVTFSSTSSGANGLAKQEWDLSANGLFKDAAGPTAQRTFTAPGSYTVALRVTDNSGLTNIAFETLTVSARPAGAAPATVPKPRAPLLSPFPIIRIRGHVLAGRTHLDLLQVQAPRGAKVTVHCRGRACPRHRLARTARRRNAVRFPELSRWLPAGTLIEVYVTRPGTIGKYTSFLTRRGRPPARTDKCLLPGAATPVTC